MTGSLRFTRSFRIIFQKQVSTARFTSTSAANRDKMSDVVPLFQ